MAYKINAYPEVCYVWRTISLITCKYDMYGAQDHCLLTQRLWRIITVLISKYALYGVKYLCLSVSVLFMD